MARYRIKERRIEQPVSDAENYWMDMRPSQRLTAEREGFEQLNALGEDEPPDAPLRDRNPWRRSWLIWLLAALAVLSFVFWSFSDYLLGEKMDFSVIARSNQLAEEESLDALKQAVVSIECAGSSGSGFNISPDGLIVTNAHVVAGGGYVTVIFPGGDQRFYVSHDIQLIDGVDLAVIDIDGFDLPCVELADDYPDTDQDVIFIGNPLGYDWTISEGTVKGVAYAGDIPVLLINGPVRPGSSGSPVFDAESRVVGVIYARLTDEEDMGLAVPITYLNTYISAR